MLYLLHMNLTAQQNQHWVNRDDGAVSSSIAYSGSFTALVCTATDDVPGLAISSGEQASVAWQELMWMTACPPALSF